MNTRLLAPTLCALLAASAAGQVRLPAILGDGMVLQAGEPARLWGWAEVDERVALRGDWMDDDVHAVADHDGRWSCRLPTPAPGGPHTITIRGAYAPDAPIVLDDVLFGEVWICSGQSNMEWQLAFIDDAAAEIAAADLPDVRLFDVAKAVAMEPADDCEGVWRRCDPGTAGSFSAVAAIYGRQLHEALDVPIGLISTCWGGTSIEAWTSAETLRDFDEFAAPLARMQRAADGDDHEPSLAQRQSAWWDRLERTDPGMTGHWMGAQLDVSAWEVAALPGTWAALGLGDFDGCVWYRRRIELPDDWAGREVVLELGPIDDMDMTFWDGQPIGGMREDGRWTTPRRYSIPPELATAGHHIVAVCAVDTGGTGSVGLPAGPMQLSWWDDDSRDDDGSAPATLPLEGLWSYRRGASADDLGPWPRESWFHQHMPSALFNGMIAPLLPLRAAGFIWYQGEANRPRAARYRALFPALIRDWRNHWNQGALPFYYVQIAPYGYRSDSGEAAELREAQTLALAEPNTGMAVTMDIGNPRDIHPTDKRPVGERLARWALARTYGRDDLACSGPMYAGLDVVGTEARLSFEHGGGLALSNSAPAAFTVAGPDRVFHPASSRIDGETVVVWSERVAEPVSVRYGWGAADQGTLINGAGLPAPSFRTDDWPLVSAAR